MYKKIGVNKLVCSLEPFNLQVVVTILLIMEEDSLEHLSKKKKNIENVQTVPQNYKYYRWVYIRYKN